jgi:hypothetical protein
MPLALMLVGYCAVGQTTKDPVGLAKQYRQEGKINEAAALLKTYHAQNKTDLNSSWLYAQTLYWLKDFKKSNRIYKEAIKAHPQNYYLQLDYGNMLIALGKTKKAKATLINYGRFDSTSTGYKSALAGMFWLDAHHKPNDILYRNLTITSADTLNLIKQLKNNGRVKLSYRLIKAYYKNHGNDFNTTWLYGQIAYLNKHFKKSKELYKKDIAAQPSNYYLKLDYGNMLVNIANYKKAKPVLNTYRNYDSANLSMHLSFAKIYLAQGNYKTAEKEIADVLKLDATNKDALALLDELLLAKASWVKIKGSYYTDSQPLKTIIPAVEAGVYLHPEATLKLNLQTPLFISNGSLKNAQWLQIGDQSAFRKAGFQLSFDAGVVKQPFENKISWSGNLELKETLLKHLVLQAEAERKPYYYTISSLDTVLMVNRYTAYVEWNDLNSVYGRLQFEFNQFPDKNYTLAGGGWIFTPPLKVWVLELRVGYAYSFSTSEHNRYTPQNTLEQIIANYQNVQTINGIYDPYFTPDNMGVHSALASLTIHPVKLFDLGFNANVGFYATTLNPYLYLNKNNSDVTYIDEGYSTMKFVPMEFSAYALFRITEKISLKADYTYRKTYFYTSNSVGVGLKINFWNEQKGK